MGFAANFRLDAAAREWMEARARGAGFDLAGVAGVPMNDEEDARFTEWIEAGYAGEMGWLTRADEDGRMVRGDLRRSLPWARSVVVCALNYNANAKRSVDAAGATQGWIARYAWSGVP
jgi:epoxyqueuosine reductase